MKPPNIDRLVSVAAVTCVVAIVCGLSVALGTLLARGLRVVFRLDGIVMGVGATCVVVGMVILFGLYGVEKLTGRW